MVVLAASILAFSFGSWKRRQALLEQDRVVHQIEQQVQSGELTQEEANTLIGEQTGQLPATNAENNDQPAVGGEGAAANQTLKEVRRSSSSIEGTEAIKLTNAFYMAYNQRSFSAMATLFTPSTAGRPEFEDVLNRAVAENSVRPISFEFENVDVRGDSSVLITIKEVRANNQGDKSSMRRLLEFIPIDGQQKIQSYFQPDSTDTISGFAN